MSGYKIFDLHQIGPTRLRLKGGAQRDLDVARVTVIITEAARGEETGRPVVRQEAYQMARVDRLAGIGDGAVGYMSAALAALLHRLRNFLVGFELAQRINSPDRRG